VLGRRKDGEYTVLIPPAPDRVYPWEKLPQRIVAALNGQHQAPAPTAETPIPEGERNARLTSLAGSLRRKGLSREAIEAALLGINAKSCKPPLSDDEITNIARSVSRYPSEHGRDIRDKNNTIYTLTSEGLPDIERDKSVTDSVTFTKKIEDFVTETTGYFSYDDLDKELGIQSSAQKTARRQVMKRLRDEGIVEKHPLHDKLFRCVKVEVRLIDFKAAGKRVPLAIRYPLGIETYFRTYPGNIIVIAGEANAGKTAFLLNLINMNASGGILLPSIIRSTSGKASYSVVRLAWM